MKKSIILFFCILFSMILPSCQIASNMSYSYINPSTIRQEKKYNVSYVENEHIEINYDKYDSVNEGTTINFEIINIEAGYIFTGWYINGVYRGVENSINLQIFENTTVEAKTEKTKQISRIGFSVGGQMIRIVFTDYSLKLTQDVFDSVLDSVSYLPYGYSIIGWNDTNGVEYKEGDIISESLTLYPIYDIESGVKEYQFNVFVSGGDVINADTFKSVKGEKLTMGTILTFNALDEDGNVDKTKAWVDENGEVYSYKPTFTMTLVKNLNLHTVDISTIDTTQPILQSSNILLEHCLAGSPYEYVNLRLYVRVIIPTEYEYYNLIDDYGARMEREDSLGQLQRATFSLNKSQWSINGEAWSKADNQSIAYTYRGSSFIDYIDATIEDNGSRFNNSGWMPSAIITVKEEM